MKIGLRECKHFIYAPDEQRLWSIAETLAGLAEPLDVGGQDVGEVCKQAALLLRGYKRALCDKCDLMTEEQTRDLVNKLRARAAQIAGCGSNRDLYDAADYIESTLPAPKKPTAEEKPILLAVQLLCEAGYIVVPDDAATRAAIHKTVCLPTMVPRCEYILDVLRAAAKRASE